MQVDDDRVVMMGGAVTTAAAAMPDELPLEPAGGSAADDDDAAADSDSGSGLQGGVDDEGQWPEWRRQLEGVPPYPPTDSSTELADAEAAAVSASSCGRTWALGRAGQKSLQLSLKTP